MRITHKRRGTTYDVIGIAIAQCEKPITDNLAVTVYRDPFSGQLWVRPVSEVGDGRFAIEPE